jgi:periplasmic protein TonB
MELNKINQSDYLDIVFEGRNQAYGAYELRKGYQKTVKRAIFFGGTLFLGLLLVPFYAFTSKADADDAAKYTPPIHVFPKPEAEKKEAPKPKQPEAEIPKKMEAPAPVKTVSFPVPVVQPDNLVEKTPPKMEEFQDAVAAQTTNKAGEKGVAAAPTAPSDGTGKTAITPIIDEPKVAEKEDKPMIISEIRPEFPGGERALMQYLADNIKYPSMARESGLDGKIYLTFVVEKDGSITDIKVRRGIGMGCDDEAKRVVAEMPRWSPGKQKGNPVRVQFTLPVHFKLE